MLTILSMPASLRHSLKFNNATTPHVLKGRIERSWTIRNPYVRRNHADQLVAVLHRGLKNAVEQCVAL